MLNFLTSPAVRASQSARVSLSPGRGFFMGLPSSASESGECVPGTARQPLQVSMNVDDTGSGSTGFTLAAALAPQLDRDVRVHDPEVGDRLLDAREPEARERVVLPRLVAPLVVARADLDDPPALGVLVDDGRHRVSLRSEEVGLG